MEKYFYEELIEFYGEYFATHKINLIEQFRRNQPHKITRDWLAGKLADKDCENT